MTTNTGPGAELLGNVVESAATALNDAGVQWCLLRDDALVGGDVDLLVAKADLRRALSAVRAVGFTRRIGWGHRPHHFFVLASRGGLQVKLDIVTELAFGRYHEQRTNLAATVLRRRVRTTAVPVPEASDRQWLVLLHALLDRGHVSARHQLAVGAWAREQEPVEGVAATIPVELRRQVGTLVTEGRWAEVAQHGAALSAAVVSAGRFSSYRRVWRAAMRRTVKLQRVLVRPGVTVALLGPDGAGKSTVARAVAERRPDTAVAYLGAYPRRKRTHTAVPGLNTLTRCFVLVITGLRVAAHRRRGRVILLDRHPLEVAWGPPAASPRGLLRRWVLAHCVARPQVVVVLDAPPEQLHARKPEHSVLTLSERRARYLQLAESLGAIVIDVDRPLEPVVADVLDVINAAAR